MYEKCPDSTDQLLNYLNNHNGGVLQTAVPTGIYIHMYISESTDQLLNYLNNHNGGVLQTAVPAGTRA